MNHPSPWRGYGGHDGVWRPAIASATAGRASADFAFPEAQDAPRLGAWESHYAQGGVVVDGIAYFTASDSSRRKGVKRTEAFPCVVAFDVNTFKKVRTYDFGFTYDSSPFVFQRKDGTWLVIAHEHRNARTVAMNRDTGAQVWASAANQPGACFFGYSFYRCHDGSKLLFMACLNGLHALSSETGEDVWWVKRRGTGGVTPCVDQENGLVFFQCNGKVLKLRAADGQVLKEVDDYARMITSCATHIIAHGKVLSGDLWEDRTVVTRIGDNSTADWPGPFGDPQTNQMAAPYEPAVTLVPVVEVGR